MWSSGILVGPQHFFCWAHGILVGTRCLSWQHMSFCWSPGILVTSRCFILVDTSHRGWHPPSLLVGTWRFVGHFAFCLLGTHRLFLWACGDLVSTWCFSGHPGFLLVDMWHLVWLARVILVGSWHFFWWTPGILGATWNIGVHPVIFLWVHGVLVTNWHLVHLVGQRAFIFVAMCHFVGHLQSW